MAKNEHNKTITRLKNINKSKPKQEKQQTRQKRTYAKRTVREEFPVVSLRLIDLCGAHWLSGVDILSEDVVPEGNSASSIEIDNLAYTFISYYIGDNLGSSKLDSIYESAYSIRNRFPAIPVYCTLYPNYFFDNRLDALVVIDAQTQKPIIIIGTDYPNRGTNITDEEVLKESHFICKYSPYNMSLNTKVL